MVLEISLSATIPASATIPFSPLLFITHDTIVIIDIHYNVITIYSYNIM